MSIALEHPDQPDVLALIAELDAYQDRLYPPEARHSADLATLSGPDAVFAVARDERGAAIGCGAVLLQQGRGELKRFYVQPPHRGRGVADRLIATLEATAIARGCALVMLETGPYQPAALAFYARHGYQRCGPFGAYAEHPLSVFMRKALDAACAACTGRCEAAATGRAAAPLAEGSRR